MVSILIGLLAALVAALINIAIVWAFQDILEKLLRMLPEKVRRPVSAFLYITWSLGAVLGFTAILYSMNVGWWSLAPFCFAFTALATVSAMALWASPKFNGQHSDFEDHVWERHRKNFNYFQDNSAIGRDAAAASRASKKEQSLSELRTLLANRFEMSEEEIANVFTEDRLRFLGHGKRSVAAWVDAISTYRNHVNEFSLEQAGTAWRLMPSVPREEHVQSVASLQELQADDVLIRRALAVHLQFGSARSILFARYVISGMPEDVALEYSSGIQG